MAFFGDGGADVGDFVEHLKDLASEAPVIRSINSIIGKVTDLCASDIHPEPFDDGSHVRYRVDGAIHPGELVPPRLSAAVGSRVKLMAHLEHCRAPPATGWLHQDPRQGPRAGLACFHRAHCAWRKHRDACARSRQCASATRNHGFCQRYLG